MPLKLMYITNKPEIATIAQSVGVDRIFVDLEYIGKAERQYGLDTVISHHTIEDVAALRSVVTTAELMVRVNPIHDATAEYCSSREEIDRVIAAGADSVMLPYFKSAEEAEFFLHCVNGRVKPILLLETPEAVADLDRILAIPGVEDIHIGLNDLSIGMGRRFLFELLADGTVESICHRIQETGISYGFGGIASIGKGLVPGEHILMEHYRLGSSAAILSRCFCDVTNLQNLNEAELIFAQGVKKIRAYEAYCMEHPELWEENRRKTAELIEQTVAQLKR